MSVSQSITITLTSFIIIFPVLVQCNKCELWLHPWCNRPLYLTAPDVFTCMECLTSNYDSKLPCGVCTNCKGKKANFAHIKHMQHLINSIQHHFV